MTDKLFKLAVVILAAGFLWVYSINSQNGQNRRYQLSGGPVPGLVLDGREGILYRPPIIQETPPN